MGKVSPMNLKKCKRAIAGLDKTIISLVVIGFVLIVGLALMQQARDTQVTNTYHCGLNSTNGTSGTLLYDGCGYAYNGSTQVMNAIDDIPGWLGTVVLAVIAVVILGIIYILRRRSG